MPARRDRSPHPVLLHIAASLLAGLAVTATINPIDVVTTRLWNQPVVAGRGTLYRGAVDCAVRTLTAEGPTGLYKGALAHFLRVGPHTVLTFLILEQVQRLMKRQAAAAGVRGCVPRAARRGRSPTPVLLGTGRARPRAPQVPGCRASAGP